MRYVTNAACTLVRIEAGRQEMHTFGAGDIDHHRRARATCQDRM